MVIQTGGAGEEEKIEKMPYIKIIRKPHECYKPTSLNSMHRGVRRYDCGSVWACEVCGQQWMIADDGSGKRYWRLMEASEFIKPNEDYSDGKA